jgi:hypothetical protein
VADDPAESARAALLRALEVRRYGRLALAIGAAVSAVVSGFFLVVVAGGRTDEPIWFYPSLAFVVFVTTAMLAAAVLVSRRVLRLAVHPAAVVRRAGTGGALAGLSWLAGAVGVALGPAQPWAAVVDVALPWAGLLTPLGLWAAYTRFKRTARPRAAVALAAVVGLVAALVLADLAAFELVALLPDVGGDVEPRIARLWWFATVGLVAAQAGLAGLVWLGDEGSLRVPVLLAGPALAGLAAYGLVGPGRLGLGCLAAGLGLGWLGTGLSLRRVADGDVPTGPDPWAAGSG